MTRPVVLIILDGWGYSAEIKNNAILAAHTPTWDNLWQEYPHALLSASSSAVGLPDNQMGNSEVGHLHMGAGRSVPQELLRINNAIENNSFFNNPVLLKAFRQAKNNNKSVHIIGLLSPGGVHSHEDHIQAAVKMAAEHQVNQCYLHAILDGRDTPPRSALKSLEKLEACLQNIPTGQIVSLIGRYYAMDRDKHWGRTQKAYDLFTQGQAEYHCANSSDALKSAYKRDESDEFVQPSSIHPDGQLPVRIQDGDLVLWMNFRADRSRQLTQALVLDNFSGFERPHLPQLGACVTLTQYEANLPAEPVFPPQVLNNTLGEYLARLGYKQLRIAETEKYAHVTFFFNGGREEAFEGEERILVPSPRIATYDLQPEMSAFTLTEKLIAAIKNQKFEVIICNYANADMVGHTGNFAATVQAIETIDQCLAQVTQALKQVGGEAIITADHGNAEMMYDAHTSQTHTAHTTEPVPFLYIGNSAKLNKKKGYLYDIAPTMLYLLGLEKPKEMTGESLLST